MVDILSREEFFHAAQSGAKKLCNSSCISVYNCGRCKKNPLSQAMKVGGSDVCPLNGYGVASETKRQADARHFRWGNQPTEEERFALCALCDNSTVAEVQDGWELERRDLKRCMDCPVFMAEEAAAELAAEAAIS